MIYAAGLPRGGADYSRWLVTYGYPKGPFPRSQVERMVKAGQLVPYMDGSDAAYTTPQTRKNLDYWRDSRARLQPPSAS
jgi:hypothetical protein